METGAETGAAGVKVTARIEVDPGGAVGVSARSPAVTFQVPADVRPRAALHEALGMALAAAAADALDGRGDLRLLIGWFVYGLYRDYPRGVPEEFIRAARNTLPDVDEVSGAASGGDAP